MYVLISLHPHEGTVHEVEMFSTRPKTTPFEPSNWPTCYRIYEGNPDGGDTVLVEQLDPGQDFPYHYSWEGKDTTVREWGY